MGSDKATVWFDDSESDSDEDDGMEEHASSLGATNVSTLATPARNPGTLSKKAQQAEAKKARMEVKREKQMEKCEEKLDKREAKREAQRAKAQAKAKNR